MTLKAMKAYEVSGEEWTPDEAELLPRFLSMLKKRTEADTSPTSYKKRQTDSPPAGQKPTQK